MDELDERFPLNGTVDEKIMTCLRAAGWYEGRQVDLNEVKAFYASEGITLPAGAEAFLREYYGIAEGWHMNSDGWTKSKDWRYGHRVRTAADIVIELNPLRGLPPVYDYVYGDQQRAEELAGEPLVYVGNIGYYYPAAVFLGSTNKIYTTHDYDYFVYCYDSLPEMLRYDFFKADEWHFVTMEQIVYYASDPRGWRD